MSLSVAASIEQMCAQLKVSVRKTCVRQPSSTDSECCQPKHCTSGRCWHNIANWPDDCVLPTFLLPTMQTASAITVCAKTEKEHFAAMTNNKSLLLFSSLMQLRSYEPSNSTNTRY